MVKLPKEINKIINTITAEGYEIYCAGQCVMASYLGKDPQDWDIYTNCPQEKVRALFPEGEKLGTRITRLDYTTEVVSDDINVADYLEGVIADVVTMNGTIEEQLKVYELAAEAIAEHPQKSPVDEFGGREDIKKMILKSCGDVEAVYDKKPEKMLKPLRYVSMYGFDLHKELSETIRKNAQKLLNGDKDEILYEFTQIVTGENAGKALKMLADLGLLAGIIGEKAVASVGRRVAHEYEILTENIDKTKQIPLRRLALVYLCFDKGYKDAVSYLPHEEKDMEYLLDAKKLVQEIHFAGNDVTLKQFIYKCGWDKFYFIDKLQKAQVIVFDYNAQKIEGREYILKIIKMEKQPIFEEDLAIDENDIMEAGITGDVERAKYLLSLLPSVVHQKPKKNDRKELLSLAKKYNRSKISVALRDVTWLR